MGAINPDSVYVRSNDVVSREIEGEIIIVPLASGIGDIEDELYTLNSTGRAIWNLIDGQRDLRGIAIDLAGQYRESLDVITRDVVGIAGELAKRKIIVCRK